MTPPFISALYDGAAVHRRLKPRVHALRYRLFWMLIDLDEAGRLAGALRLFSHNRFNLFALHDRDHLDGSTTPLRVQVERTLAAHDLPVDGGPIRLLCVPRILGHAFNPLSVYLCHRRDGALSAILYEVNNTFGQRHCYLAAAGRDGPVRQSAPKRFYVSPFMDMGLTYGFRVQPPGDRVVVGVTARDASGPVIVTHFAGTRRALSDAALLRAFASHPLMTVKVVAGIHWEALKLWRKGLRLRPRPPPPALPVTLGHLDHAPDQPRASLPG